MGATHQSEDTWCEGMHWCVETEVHKMCLSSECAVCENLCEHLGVFTFIHMCVCIVVTYVSVMRMCTCT